MNKNELKEEWLKEEKAAHIMDGIFHIFMDVIQKKKLYLGILERL